MPRPKAIFPAYRLHKQSGLAYCLIDGKQRFVGKHGTPESRQRYDRLIAEYLANGRRLAPDARTATNDPQAAPTVSMLIEAFWTHAQAFYTKPASNDAGETILEKDGTPHRIPTKQLAHFKAVLIPLRWMYGPMKAGDFGCPQLEALREAFIRPGQWQTAAGGTVHHQGWSRSHTNRQIGRLRHVFSWGATKRIVPASVFQELLLLPGLRRGNTAARETRKVRPLDLARALAIIPHVNKQIGTMLQVQILSGMRSSEICIMRPADIDRSATPWIYRPMFHKTQDRDIKRDIPLGPKARKLLKPFLKARDPQSFLFSPAEAEAHRRALLHKQRKTPVQPSQVKRARKAASRRNRKREPGIRYDAASYYGAIRKGIERAFKMPEDLKRRGGDTPEQARARGLKRKAWHAEHGFHPHQARHRTATDVRKAAGIEAAQAVLGHADSKTTQRYAEQDQQRANDIIEKIG